ncbi:MAG: sigma-70 family RNA polymerase sigma factor [Clostridiales bacterium]|mgnify:FL=1|jgi:RNA polymerase sporulation-specific sigma factor|nr:sigma-70 family RNA polymerase sigma factor [Clostridiales bacterium]
MEIYSNLSDNELLCLTESGDKVAEEQLALRYTRLVKICSRPFFLVGGDGEDLIQEGMLGLLSAIREFDLSMNTSFKTYAEICVKRRIYSAIKTASRKKHEPLNDMVSFDDVLSDESKSNAVAYGEVYRRTPEEQVLARESADEIIQTYSRCLSKFESEILNLYLSGLSYSEIAEVCGRTEKSVDNAVQRIRRKLAHNLYLSDTSDS